MENETAEWHNKMNTTCDTFRLYSHAAVDIETDSGEVIEVFVSFDAASYKNAVVDNDFTGMLEICDGKSVEQSYLPIPTTISYYAIGGELLQQSIDEPHYCLQQPEPSITPNAIRFIH